MIPKVTLFLFLSSLLPTHTLLVVLLYILFPYFSTLLLKLSVTQKNLLIAYCTCDHSSKIYPRGNKRYWSINFCDMLKEKYKDEIEIKEWEYLKDKKVPILIHRKRRY